MPGTCAELLDRAEAAVLLAVLEDLLRGRRPDAGQRVELLERRGVEVDRRRRCGPAPRAAPAGAGGRAARRRRARRGTSDLAPVLELGGEVDARRGRPAGVAPPARADRVVDARARRAAGRRPGRRTAPATCTITACRRRRRRSATGSRGAGRAARRRRRRPRRRARR